VALERPVAVKTSVRAPAAPVITRLLNVATPLALVVAVVVPPSAPAPEAIAAVTTTPDWLTALPAPSRSWIAGCWANAVPLTAAADGCVVIDSAEAAAALIVTVDDVTALIPDAVNCSAYAPMPEMFKPENVATPLAFVVAVVVPPSVPPVPLAIAAVTTTPD